MSSALSQITPTGPVPLPLTEQQAEDYLATLATKPRNKLKDYARDLHEPEYYFDIAAIERDLDAGKLPFKPVDHPVNGWQWGLRIANGAISQNEGGGVDLMYAASMPAERTLKRLILIEFPEGLSMIDGSHRIARAMIDGRRTQPGALVDYAAIASYRVPEAQVESGA